MKTLYINLVTNTIILMLNKVLLQLTIIVNGGKSKFVHVFNRLTMYDMCLNTNLLTKVLCMIYV